MRKMDLKENKIGSIGLALWCDRQENKYLVACPKCHRLINYDSLHALYLAMVDSERKCCQGCRAKVSFEHNPGLIGLYLDFWFRTGAWPQSPSWLEAIPPSRYNLWAKEIQAGLEAATAPLRPIKSVPLGPVTPGQLLLAGFTN